MSEQEKLQSLVLELRMLEETFKEIDARESIVASAIIESRSAIEAIKEFPSGDPSEILMPIGGGIFFEASAPPPDKFLINIGAGAVVEKTKEETVNFLEERIKELERAILTFESQKADLVNRINSNRAAINSIVEKQKRTSIQ
ncbi:MAG: prefoldin subunit alpha [Candidatus Methylarchaceae archaeon HK02M1]|nr:prefoldin subunit alpha [Candidatus Methylarchaceae archaeon HK01M]MCP8312655.1 prefoldin subunit alpha [Candidatus Methylarchaceae archaeon HK02M1]